MFSEKQRLYSELFFLLLKQKNTYMKNTLFKLLDSKKQFNIESISIM